MNFLFVKFETQPVTGTQEQREAHKSNFFKSIFKKSSTSTLDERRENDTLTIYTRTPANSLSQKDKDINFYTTLGLSTKTLEWYNTNVRIGQEFFVSQKLLEYLLMNYLFTSYTCPGKGGKSKTRQKRNKKTNKKTQKRNKKTNKKNKRNKKNKTRKRYN